MLMMFVNQGAESIALNITTVVRGFGTHPRPLTARSNRLSSSCGNWQLSTPFGLVDRMTSKPEV